MARDNSRMKYGRCINEECEMCSKDVKHPIVQEISGRKEFVCAKCGHELRECLPPSGWWDSNKKWCLPLAVLAVVGIGGGVYLCSDSGTDTCVPENGDGSEITSPIDSTPSVTKKETKTTTTTKKDTAVVAPVQPEESLEVSPTDIVKKKPSSTTKETAPSKASSVSKASSSSSATYGTVSVAGGSYTGDLKNGKPHGHGTITYKKSTNIGSSQYVANPGDTFEGEFRDGRISGGLGYWVHDGNTEAIKL